MRGDDENRGGLFSRIDLEKRIRIDHPLGRFQEIANAGLRMLSRDFARLYVGIGDRHCTGEAAGSDVTAGVLLGPVRAPVDGADLKRPAVPLVCGTWHR
jgi:hypothetical protein